MHFLGLGRKAILENRDQPPCIPAVIEHAIPTDLRVLPQWVVWQYQRRDDKWTKVPLNPRTRHPASVTNPKHWGSFAAAMTARHLGEGVGFVFTPDDPFVGLDLDDCLATDGQLTPWAVEVLEEFPTYTEVSPSGTGLKLFLRGKLPPGRRRKDCLELYDSGRYFTVTGRRWQGTVDRVVELQHRLDEWYPQLFPSPDPSPPRQQGEGLAGAAGSTGDPSPQRQQGEPQPLDPRINAALAEPGNGRLGLLWAGRWVDLYSSPSNADMALCSLLLKLLGPDPQGLDRAFRQSGLMRGKWDERRGELTYGQRTVRAVLQGLSTLRPDDQLWPELIAAVASTIVPEQIDWLWPGWLARGKLAVLEGDPGLGKSTLTMDLAARVSTGSPMPGSTLAVTAGTVLIASAEDSPGQTIRPRLEAAGADLTRIRLIDGVLQGALLRPVFLPDDLGPIEEQMKSDNTHLLVIDPLMAFLGSDSRGRAIDSHKDQSVRLLLSELTRLAERTTAAVVLVRHLNKVQGSSAILRGGGSIGIGGAARSVLMVGKHPDDDTQRVLAMTKCNLGQRPLSRAFRVVSAETSVGPMARLQWLEELDLSSDELLKPAESGRMTKREEAVEFLRQALADGEVAQAELVARGKERGLSEATLIRARHDLGAKAVKHGRPAAWFWKLPEEFELPPLE